MAPFEAGVPSHRPVLVVFGTRPEVIKLFPLIAELRERLGSGGVTTVSTGQQPDLLADVIGLLDAPPDIEIETFSPGQPLTASHSRVVQGVAAVIEDVAPSLVIVQGDTTTTFGAAIAASYAGVPVVHLEAGLRSHDRSQPFPEEIHRSLVTRLAALHIAPTRTAEENLRREGVSPADIVVTGNTGQDALRIALERLPEDEARGNRLIVATLHRRESEAHVEYIAEGLRRAATLPGISIKVLRHPNPFVSGRFVAALGTDTSIEVIAPLPFTEMIRTLRGCRAVLTDSGGLQEEAAALGVPALVVRDTTCRPEGVESGSAVLVERTADAVFSAIERVVNDESHRASMAVPRRIYGDGYAAARAVERIVTRFGLSRSGQ